MNGTGMATYRRWRYIRNLRNWDISLLLFILPQKMEAASWDSLLQAPY